MLQVFFIYSNFSLDIPSYSLSPEATSARLVVPTQSPSNITEPHFDTIKQVQESWNSFLARISKLDAKLTVCERHIPTGISGYATDSLPFSNSFGPISGRFSGLTFPYV